MLLKFVPAAVLISGIVTKAGQVVNMFEKIVPAAVLRSGIVVKDEQF